MKICVLLVVVACGTTAEPMVDRHAPGTCDQVWINNGFDQCETGCVDSSIALNAMGPSCTAKTASGRAAACTATFELGGIIGCCVSESPHVYFADCD